MRKKLISIILALFLICSILIALYAYGNNFSKFESQFMDEYYKLIENIYSKDADDILFRLQSKQNADILANMNKILNDNKDIRKGHKEKFDKLYELYTGLVDLKDAYGNYSSLDLDTQLYLNSQLTYIYVYKSQLEYDKKQKESKNAK